MTKDNEGEAKTIESRAKQRATEMADRRVKAAHDSTVKEGQRLSTEWQTVVQRVHTEWKAWVEGTEANVMKRIKELEVQVHNEQTRAGNADLLVNQLQQAGAQRQRDLDTAKQTGAQLQYDLDTAQQAVNKLTNDLNTALQRDHPDIMPGIQAPVTSNVADQNRIKGLVQEVIQLNQMLTELGNGDAKDRWQDALGHVLEANQTLKKVQSAVDRDGVTYPQLMQILMEATICEQDFDSIATFIDDKT